MALFFDSFYPRGFAAPSYGYYPTYRAPADPFFSAPRSSLLDAFATPPFAEFFALPQFAQAFDVDMEDTEEPTSTTVPLSASAPAILPPGKAEATATETDAQPNEDEPNVENVDLTGIDESNPSPSDAPATANSAETTKATDSAVAAPQTAAVPSLWSRNRTIKMASNDTHLIVKADLAGIPKENIELKLDNGYLTVKANNKSESRNSAGQVTRRQVESISRSFFVGKQVDPATIQATYNNGDFQVSIPKPKPAGHSIQIN